MYVAIEQYQADDDELAREKRRKKIEFIMDPLEGGEFMITRNADGNEAEIEGTAGGVPEAIIEYCTKVIEARDTDR